MRTSYRIALLAGLLALAANLALIGFIHWRTYDEAASTLQRQVSHQSLVLEQIYDAGGPKSLFDAIDGTVGPDDPQAIAAVLGNDGKLVTGNVAALITPGLLSEGFHTGIVRLSGDKTAHESGVYLHRLDGDRWLLSGRVAGEGLALRNTLERSLLIGAVLSLLLGALCGLLVARYVAQRVADIVHVAERIGDGDLSQRIPVGPARDPFESLGTQINAMLDRIQLLMGELRMLTDSLAHDLRSPVGRLRAAAERAIAAPDEQQRDLLLGNVIQQSDALMRILTTVLEIGRTESFASRSQFTKFDAAGLCAELAEMYEPVAEEAGAELQWDAAGTAVIDGHRQLLAQAISNLIENALKYGTPGGHISLRTGENADHVTIEVADRGPGIPAAQRAAAVRRFGRLDESRSTAGAGLGLTLAQSIAHLHGGELVLADAGPGLIARLQLPHVAA
jgi:signal transduction histidine kinase